VLLAADATAQEAERTYQKRAYFDFDDDVVQGELLAPDGAFLSARGTGRMQRANRMAAEILEHRMRRKRPSDLKLIREAAAADVIVVRGHYDHVEQVLQAVKIKHVVVPQRLLDRVPLMSLQTVMINCPGRLGPKAHKNLRRFVKTGGFLVTTDWALSDLEKIVPGYVSRGARNTQNDVVEVQIHKGDTPLLSHVLATKGRPRWWLEAGSYPIRILNREKVQVLISSQEMRKKYGHAPVAVAFRHDDGRVLHMTSHFYLQQSKLVSAKEKSKGTSFAKAAGLDGDSVKKLKKKGLDRVEAGAINSAYSMQQVTTNMLVAKARENKQLLARFPHRAARTFQLRVGPAPGAAKLKQGEVEQRYLLRVLRRQGTSVQVRDLFGREGWTAAANLTSRETDTAREAGSLPRSAGRARQTDTAPEAKTKKTPDKRRPGRAAAAER